MKTKTSSIQKSLDELNELVKYFEQEEADFDLDLAVAKYEQAMKLVRSVRKELTGVEQRIKEIQHKYADESEEIEEENPSLPF